VIEISDVIKVLFEYRYVVDLVDAVAMAFAYRIQQMFLEAVVCFLTSSQTE
jgi:hypothetical protein